MFKIGRLIDLTGRRFGHLTVIERAGYDESNKHLFWKCQCDCGAEFVAGGDGIRSGSTTSCGCHRRYVSRTKGYKHGQTHTRLYRVWAKMKQRCCDPNDKDYKYYGARGINVCEEWMESKNFFDWALSHGYEDNLTIERLDNYKGYCPDNCAFIKREDQCKNQRNTLIIEIDGEKWTLRDISKKTGITYDILRRRYKKGIRGEQILKA